MKKLIIDWVKKYLWLYPPFGGPENPASSLPTVLAEQDLAEFEARVARRGAKNSRPENSNPDPAVAPATSAAPQPPNARVEQVWEEAIDEFTRLAGNGFPVGATEDFRDRYQVVPATPVERDGRTVLSFEEINPTLPRVWVLTHTSIRQDGNYIVVPSPEICVLRYDDSQLLRESVRGIFTTATGDVPGTRMTHHALADPLHPSGHFPIVKLGTIER